MTDWRKATKENILNLKDVPYDNTVDVMFRMSPAQKNNVLSQLSTNKRLLNNRLRDIFLEYAEKRNATNFAVAVEIACSKSESIIRKVLSGERHVTKDFLGHICVGLQLSMAESEELFMLFGQPLRFENSYFDALTMTAISDKDDIYYYAEELKKYKELTSKK